MAESERQTAVMDDRDVLADVLHRFLHSEGYWSLTEMEWDDERGKGSHHALTIDTGVELTATEAEAIKRVTNGRTCYKD